MSLECHPKRSTRLWDTSGFSKHPPHQYIWKFYGFSFQSMQFFFCLFFSLNVWWEQMTPHYNKRNHLIFLSRRSGNVFSLLLQFQSLDQHLEMFRWHCLVVSLKPIMDSPVSHTGAWRRILAFLHKFWTMKSLFPPVSLITLGVSQLSILKHLPLGVSNEVKNLINCTFVPNKMW